MVFSGFFHMIVTCPVFFFLFFFPKLYSQIHTSSNLICLPMYLCTSLRHHEPNLKYTIEPNHTFNTLSQSEHTYIQSYISLQPQLLLMRLQSLPPAYSPRPAPNPPSTQEIENKPLNLTTSTSPSPNHNQPIPSPAQPSPHHKWRNPPRQSRYSTQLPGSNSAPQAPPYHSTYRIHTSIN